MQTRKRILLSIGIALALVLPARSDTTRTQTIQLRQGWNSVYLEVNPVNSDPGVVFSNTPVRLVATYLMANTPVEYIQNPSNIRWKKDGWGVWYSPDRADAFLSTLHSIDGNRAYLVFCEQDHVWSQAGTVTHEPVKWKSDSFNHVGFGVAADAPPTFEQFFKPSPAHRHYRIYRLQNDKWTMVTDPVGTRMRAGEACWVHCKGGSDYSGPLSVKLPMGRQVVFNGGSSGNIVLANSSVDPSSITVETVSSDAGLPMSYVIRGITTGRLDNIALDLPPVHRLPTMESGESTTLRLRARTEAMNQSSQSALLKISTDLGVQVWVPVSATRSDLVTAP